MEIHLTCSHTWYFDHLNIQHTKKTLGILTGLLTSMVFPQKNWQVRQSRQSRSQPVWPAPAQSAECYRPSHPWKEKYTRLRPLQALQKHVKEKQKEPLTCGSCCGSEGRPVPAEHHVWWQQSLLLVKVFYELKEEKQFECQGMKTVCVCFLWAHSQHLISHIHMAAILLWHIGGVMLKGWYVDLMCSKLHLILLL